MTQENSPDAAAIDTAVAAPRDASWVSALPLVVGALALLALLKACGVVGDGGGGLAPGTYRCFTTTVTASARQPRTREQLREQTGQDMVRDIIPPSMLLVPAFFGNIVIDDDGGYTLSGNGHAGDYRASGGELSFTGDLGGLSVRGFDPANNRFTLVYRDMGFQCGLTR